MDYSRCDPLYSFAVTGGSLVSPLIVMKVFARLIYGCLLTSSACASHEHVSIPLASAETRLYDNDPEHLWNRLHRALLIRLGDDGKGYGQDEVDPLLFPTTRHLLSGSSHQDTITLLDNFLEQGGHELVRDPLKRAVLQHDLIAIFQWAALRPDWRPDLAILEPARKRLRARLAQAISRIALSTDEIRSLPDTYAAAVASHYFPADFEPGKPDAAFLPRDLFKENGPWVCVGPRRSGRLDPALPPAAPVHAISTANRSAFMVFLSLPGGRNATLSYLDRLREFPRHSVVGKDGRLEANPELPQFPERTRVALVRQMILIDNTGNPIPTRLTETVEIRVYQEVSRNPQGWREQAAREQLFFQIDFSRTRLFASHAGGMRSIGDRKDLHDGGDPFESNRAGEHPVPVGMREIRLKKCAGCHTGGGMFSVKSFYPHFNFGTNDADSIPRPLAPRRPEEELIAAAERLKMSHSFGLMRGLLER